MHDQVQESPEDMANAERSYMIEELLKTLRRLHAGDMFKAAANIEWAIINVASAMHASLQVDYLRQITELQTEGKELHQELQVERGGRIQRDRIISGLMRDMQRAAQGFDDDHPFFAMLDDLDHDTGLLENFHFTEVPKKKKKITKKATRG